MKEEQIFHQVLEQPVEHRAAFLEAACGTDVALRQRIAVILSAQENPGSFLQHPVCCVAELPTLAEPILERIGSQIGPYKLLEEIGQGGMGTVYMAEQVKPVRRCVALKIVKAGMDSRQVLARFDTERQALALMDHPSIARIIDAGTTELGRPYFVMELVRGIPINEFCDENRLTVPERLELFLKVCQAVQHAHQKGIIHRDLKPTNVLVTKLDVVAIPKVIDFGIAKAFSAELTDHTQVTGFSQFLGTPQYMSPEQAEMNQLGVDTRSDVYSLGVMLYELLTGDTPFDKRTLKEANFVEFRRKLLEEEPLNPSSRISTLNAQALSTVSECRSSDPRRLSNFVRGELDWIVMKALEKDRNRRYESASSFAQDIQCYLNNEAVQACPPTSLYRLKKVVLRNKSAFVASAVVFGALLTSTIVLATANLLISSGRLKLISQRQIAEKNERLALAAEKHSHESELKARQFLYAANIQIAQQLYRRGNTTHALSKLDWHLPKDDFDDVRGFEWHYLNELCSDNYSTLHGHSRDVFRVAYSPDGKWLASCSRDRTVVVWDTSNGTPLTTLRKFADDINSVVFSPDGTLLATAEENMQARVWDWRTASAIACFTQFSQPVGDLFFTSDQKYLVTTELDWDYTRPGGYRTTVWDLATQDLNASLDGYRTLAVHAESELLAARSFEGVLGLWSLPNLEPKATWKGPVGVIHCGAFTPDAQYLTIGGDAVLSSWRLEDQAEFRFPTGGLPASRNLSFTPDGQQLVSCNGVCLVVWETSKRCSQKIISNQRGRLWSATVAPDGKTFASATEDGSILLRRIPETNVERRTIYDSPFTAVAMDQHSRYLAIADSSSNAVMLNLETESAVTTVLHPRGTGVQSVAFAPNGRSMWLGDLAGVVLRYDLKSNEFDGTAETDVSDLVGRLALAPATGLSFLGARQDTFIVWNSDGSVLRLPSTSLQQHHIGFVNDHVKLSTIQVHGQRPDPNVSVGVWNAENGAFLQTIQTAGFPLSAAADRSGKIVATCGSDATIQLRDIESQHVFQTLIGRNYAALAFSPDGNTLAAATSQGEIHLWHLTTGQMLLDLSIRSGDVGFLAFTADSRRLICAVNGHEIYVWGISPDTSPTLNQPQPVEQEHALVIEH